MSDVAATTQPGAADQAIQPAAASTEDRFQSFWDSQPGVEPERRDDAAAQPEQPEQGKPDLSNAAQEGQDAPQGDEQDAPEYESLDALLTALKVDPQSVMKLHVTTKIDGVEQAVPLEQIIKSYQLEGHVNNKSIELSNQRTAFEQQQREWQQAQQQVIQQHNAMAQLALQELNHDFNRVDWNALRTQNPAEYAALQAEFGQRQQRINGFLQQVNQAAQEQAAQQQQAIQQNLAKEQEKLYAAIPEWRDPQAFSKAREQITQYARGLGFQDAELSQIYDHRYMRILHDAAQFRALQANVPQALNKVRQAPIVAKPGSRQDVNPKEAGKKQALERAYRNPRDEDAMAAAFDVFANS